MKEALLYCLKDTDCYKKYGYTPRECLDDTKPGTNPQCAKFAQSLATCKFDLVRTVILSTHFQQLDLINKDCIDFETHLSKVTSFQVDRKRRFRGVRGVNNMSERASEDEM